MHAILFRSSDIANDTFIISRLSGAGDIKRKLFVKT